MQAIVLEENGVRVATDYPEPQPQPGEVLVQVMQAGICETDLQLMQGYMGYRGVLGHEFVGVAQSGKFAGQRVVGEINCHCQTCDTCRAGLGRHCPQRTVLGILQHDGAFANIIAVPEINLHPVPDSVTNDQAVFTEPLAAAFEIPAQFDVNGKRTLILGAGRLGNLCAQVLHIHGANVTVIGKHPKKLKLLDALGISTLPLEELRLEKQADVVVDCTGSPSGFATALQLVRPRGTIVLKTTVAGEQTLSLAPIVIDELTVIGSRCGPFDKALVALTEGSIQVEPLISARLPLAEFETGIHLMQTEPVLKILLEL